MHLYSGAVVLWCTGTLIHWYIGEMVHWCTSGAWEEPFRGDKLTPPAASFPPSLTHNQPALVIAIIKMILMMVIQVVRFTRFSVSEIACSKQMTGRRYVTKVSNDIDE